MTLLMCMNQMHPIDNVVGVCVMLMLEGDVWGDHMVSMNVKTNVIECKNKCKNKWVILT